MNFHLLLSMVYNLNFSYIILNSLLIALIAYITYFYYKYFTRENPLPGPFPLPVIGNTSLFTKDSFNNSKDFHTKYGDLCEFYLGPKRFILVSDNDLVQKILKPIIRGPFHNKIMNDNGISKEINLNVGLASNSNYEDWSFHRRFFTKVLMAPKFVRQSVNVVQDNFQEMTEYWDKLGDDKVLEFNYWMKQYFFDTIFFTATSKPAYALANYYNKINPGKELNIPKGTLKESAIFAESVDAYLFGITWFLAIPKIIRNLPGFKKKTKYLKDKINWLKNSIDNIIESRREEISKTPIDQELTPDILTMFLTVNTERDVTERIADDLHDKPLSDKDVETNFASVMAGGIDTSSNTMCFLVHCLENNPRVKQKMIEEIGRVLGKDPDSKLKVEDLSKLEYVEAVINETLRLKPVVSRIARYNSVPEVVGGYKWSKDTMFLINAEGIHNNKSYWKDPDAFNPDRFFEGSESKNYLYMFGGGLRKCPGRNLAMMELKATLAMLYRKYDIKLMGPLKEHITTIRSCDELKVSVKKRIIG